MKGLEELKSQQHPERLDLLNGPLGVRAGLFYNVKEPALPDKPEIPE